MIKLCPSLMCADFGKFADEIAAMDVAGVDEYHMDIMDGEFVPNFALSWADFATIRKMTKTPMDVHLMVKNPGIHLPYAYRYGADKIYVHYESGDAEKYLQEIRANGRQAGLAINPSTTINNIKGLLPMIDSLMVMRVNPGFAGQSALPEVEDKIAELASMPNRNFTIKLDGCVGADVIKKWAAAGVEEFVCGTACRMFGPKRNGRSYTEIVNELKQR